MAISTFVVRLIDCAGSSGGVAAGTSDVGVFLTAWGLGSALADLSSTGGPPLGLTIAGLAWGTVLLAASGLALDYLFSAK